MSSLIFRITYNAVLTPKAASSNMTNSRLLKTWVLVNRFLLLICKRYVGYHKSFFSKILIKRWKKITVVFIRL